IAGAAKSVDQTQVDALLAGPDQPAENVSVLLQAGAASRLDDFDKLRVDAIEQSLHVRDVLGIGRQERIEETLMLSGSQQSAFNAHLFHCLDESEAVHAYADRTNHAGLVGVDLVRGHRD